MKKSFVLLALVALPASASGARTLDCAANTQVEFDVTIESSTKIQLAQDGGELGGIYAVNPAADTASYAAFSATRTTQADGEQPKEVKLSRGLLNGTANAGYIWLSPGILTGSFYCTAQSGASF